MTKPNQHGPCLEKQCSWCCHPVKVPETFPDKEIPRDQNEDPLWVENNESIIAVDGEQKTRLKSFSCTKYNKETGLCDIHDKRPDICRSTSCLLPESTKTIDEQHREVVETPLIRLTKKQLR